MKFFKSGAGLTEERALPILKHVISRLMESEPKVVRVEGKVEEALPGLLFRVFLDGQNKKEVLAHLGGKLKLHRIRVIPGDRVTIEMTPYDDKRGRIVRRL